MTHRVIIVGGGTAGCVLAARLSEDELTDVLLLEAGPDFRTADELPSEIRSAWEDLSGTTHDWGYQSEDRIEIGPRTPDFATRRSDRVPVFRGKVIGGGSSVNATNAMRSKPADFDRWQAFGLTDWSWDAVLPYFRRMEDDDLGGALHGIGGPVPIRRFTAGRSQRPISAAFLDACREVGYEVREDLNDGSLAGAAPLPMNQVDGTRMSMALCYLNPVRDRPNLEVRGGALVDRVDIEDFHARAVVLASGERLEADTVVLAAGTIGSPSILLRSGIGSADALAALGIPVIADLRAVGRNLREHPMAYLAWSADENAVGDITPPLQAVLAMSSAGPSSGLEADLNVVPFTLAPGQVMAGVGLVLPLSLGSVELQSTDPEVAPLIKLNILDHPEDLQRMVAGVKLTREIFESQALSRFVTGELFPGPDVVSDADIVEVIRASKNTYSHPTSTCSMGPEGTPWAVVGQRGKVHGLDGLHVIDASILPTVPSVPPNTTVAMVAERCAEALRALVAEAPALPWSPAIDAPN